MFKLLIIVVLFFLSFDGVLCQVQSFSRLYPAEEELFSMVNNARIQRKLIPLVHNDTLDSLAYRYGIEWSNIDTKVNLDSLNNSYDQRMLTNLENTDIYNRTGEIYVHEIEINVDPKEWIKTLYDRVYSVSGRNGSYILRNYYTQTAIIVLWSGRTNILNVIQLFYGNK